MAGHERRALIDLFPQFLGRRRRGWHELDAMLDAFDLARPEFFLLQAIVQELDPGDVLAASELRARLFNPYSTINLIFDHLPALVEKEYLDRSDNECYSATSRGYGVVTQIERAAHDYLATLTPLPPADLRRLARTLSDLAARMWSAPEPADKAHQARTQRLPIPPDAPPMVELEHAVFALWTARDDAHNAAWRAAGFGAPPFDLLTRVWHGEATTIDQLRQAVGGGQRPEDIERGVHELVEAGYLERRDDSLALTPRGREIKNAIEHETDRIYFAPWPPLSVNEIHWLTTTLQAVINWLDQHNQA